MKNHYHARAGVWSRIIGNDREGEEAFLKAHK